jgi:hypothetical protein
MRTVLRAVAPAVQTFCCTAASARAEQDVIDGFTARTFTAPNGETEPALAECVFSPRRGAPSRR